MVFVTFCAYCVASASETVPNVNRGITTRVFRTTGWISEFQWKGYHAYCKYMLCLHLCSLLVHDVGLAHAHPTLTSIQIRCFYGAVCFAYDHHLKPWSVPFIAMSQNRCCWWLQCTFFSPCDVQPLKYRPHLLSFAPWSVENVFGGQCFMYRLQNTVRNWAALRQDSMHCPKPSICQLLGLVTPMTPSFFAPSCSIYAHVTHPFDLLPPHVTKILLSPTPPRPTLFHSFRRR